VEVAEAAEGRRVVRIIVYINNNNNNNNIFINDDDDDAPPLIMINRRPYSTGGSGSIFIAAHCEHNFKPGMTRQQAMDFVDLALRLAMSSDGSSGGSVRKVIIDASGVERTYTGGVF
jgi:hypothetical protein